MTTRADILRELGRQAAPWDVLVIGGGATGLGAAVEAASRGYRTLLVERCDFAKGTSSRSTKLVHGGVRYLEQLDLRLVLDALRERGHMLRNAPHLVHDQTFVVPAYSYSSLPYYGLGLKIYERLSGRLSFGRFGVALPQKHAGDAAGISWRWLCAAAFSITTGSLTMPAMRSRCCAPFRIWAARPSIMWKQLAYRERRQGHRHPGARPRRRRRLRSAGQGRDQCQRRFAEEIAGNGRGAHESLLAVSQGTHFVLPIPSWPEPTRS